MPDYILQKPAKLTESELLLMQRHTIIGYDILAGSASPLLRAAADIALTHHERYDGTGYPNRLRGDAIPLVGRIVAVADVFDALTTRRPYKRAWTAEAAFAVVHESRGHHFDPACADAFLSATGEVLKLRELLKDQDATEEAIKDLPMVAL
ncbi:MAG: HD domain-containing phosphohydrolase [Gemmatimonadaceae bacterium]